jgi:site-specific DNA-cytosine methylase
MHEYTLAILFGGIGGASLGFLGSRGEALGKVGRFRIVCSIDCDPVANRNHDIITGTNTAVTMDLFSREQYLDFHGHEPPADWQEVEPWYIWEAFGEQVPDVVFTSPPCKGFSGLLPEKSARSKKYQALNQLTIRGIELTLRACTEYGGDIPSFFLLENVPRIKTRGAAILQQIEKLLKRYGYAIDMHDHNCGELGGLGQNRMRFLLIARNEKRVPNFCYLPPKKPLRTIGDVIGPMPLPGDTIAGGPMHRLPNLQWKTWVRLALIPAGGDWRDLNRIPWEQYKIVHEPRGGAYAIEKWDEPSRTVSSTAGPGRSNGVAAVADPRLKRQKGKHPGVYRVVRFDEPSPCVTGTRFGSGAIAIADPRTSCRPRSGTYGVQKWDEPSKTVIGAGDIHAGAVAVADPRVPADHERGVWVIIAEDGTWHRPLTTYELAILQGFPTHLPDGRPFQLEGCNDAKAREYIGNAVPPDAAKAMGDVILTALMEAEAGITFRLSWDEIWVKEGTVNENYVPNVQ